MSEWDNPIDEKWISPVKEQAIFYINKIYSQGYTDGFNNAINEIKNNTVK